MIRYISTWMWHILGMIFLVAAIIIMVLGVTAKDYAWAIGMFIAVVICEIFSVKRRLNLRNAE